MSAAILTLSEMVKMPVYHTPHTEAWFSALEACKPRHAAHTKLIVEIAGKDEVCSVCGDEPAADYKLDAQDLDATAVASIRLCETCRKIRELGGRVYQPLIG
jgi:hypothetical protein